MRLKRPQPLQIPSLDAAFFARALHKLNRCVSPLIADALGRCHPDASGYTGPWTQTPTQLTNAYYGALLYVPWTLKEWDGPMQFEDPSGKLMMLPSDIALIQDPKFRKHVVACARAATPAAATGGRSSVGR